MAVKGVNLEENYTGVEVRKKKSCFYIGSVVKVILIVFKVVKLFSCLI